MSWRKSISQGFGSLSLQAVQAVSVSGREFPCAGQGKQQEQQISNIEYRISNINPISCSTFLSWVTPPNVGHTVGSGAQKFSSSEPFSSSKCYLFGWELLSSSKPRWNKWCSRDGQGRRALGDALLLSFIPALLWRLWGIEKQGKNKNTAPHTHPGVFI